MEEEELIDISMSCLVVFASPIMMIEANEVLETSGRCGVLALREYSTLLCTATVLRITYCGYASDPDNLCSKLLTIPVTSESLRIRIPP